MTSTTLSHTATRTLGNRLMITAGSMFMGAMLVYFAGFSHIDTIHNAAHDTRHSSGFPCH